MKDIRISKKSIKSKSIVVYFYKINFSFFSKILVKYSGNQYVKSLISQSVPLTFLVDSADNDMILKSISEIIDILKKKKEEEKLENHTTEKNTTVEKLFNSNKNYSDYNYSKTINNFDSPPLTFHKSQNNEKIVQALESLVVNIKKNLKSKKNIYNQKSSENKTENNNTVENHQDIDLKNEIIKSTVVEDKKYSEKEKKDESKEKNSPELENYTYSKSKSEEINKIDVKEIAKNFRKINEDIIQKKINSIKIQKINYDFISKDKILEKNIFNKISKTITNIVTKNNKFKHFSEFSKNIISLNKKIKTKKTITQLNKIIELNEKFKQNHFLEKSYGSTRSSFYFNNFKHYSNSSESNKILKSISIFHNLISKKNFDFIKTKKNINNNILNNKKIEKKYFESSILSTLKKNKKEKITKLVKSEYFRENAKSFINKFNYRSDFINFENMIKSVSSFSNSIFGKSFDFLNFKKVFDFTKNKEIKIKFLENSILSSIINKKREKKIKFEKSEYLRENVKSFINKFNYRSDFVNFDNIIKSISSFSNLVFNKSSKITSLEKMLNFTKNKKYLSDSFIRSSDSYTYLKNRSKAFDFLNIISNITKLSKKYLNIKFKDDFNQYNTNTKKNVLLDGNKTFSSEFLDKNINKYIKNDIELKNDYNVNRNIIYKNKLDINNIISNALQKIYKEKSKTETKKENKIIYNENLIKNREESEKVNKKKINTESIKQEVEKIVKSYMESINFKKISEEAIENVESKIRFERYRNGIS